MAQNDAVQITDEESLKDIFDKAMKMYNDIETSNEANNSNPMQVSIRAAIALLEKATNLVSVSGMFSSNERIEELPTDSLQYLLLPSLLGTLWLKITGPPRSEVIRIAEIYFRDFLQRCVQYGVDGATLPGDHEEEREVPHSETAKIASMVMTREAKIKRYKEMKELEERLSSLGEAGRSGDEDARRDHALTTIQLGCARAADELAAIAQEKPILQYMEQHKHEREEEVGTATRGRGARRRGGGLHAVIIARDAAQKAVYGAGYPALPAMSIEEFYEQRAQAGIFPAAQTHSHTQPQQQPPQQPQQQGEDDDDEQARKERLQDADDPEERQRQLRMDEYKDEHRRGWGNRYNRS